ncbi:hypothetical protein E2C01_081309 [Portunus trituberculatus]|uniref:Uncharacterized protein n=1 Tax=Portunus trituberculatus TaxID=210409 RepID=A0A5B7IWA8_PORTR|nr:hypothetical protein [Portunus trituberculatus]
MTSPHSDQSATGEGVTSSPVSNQSESGAIAEAGGGESTAGATSPVDKDLKEAIDTTVKSLSDRSQSFLKSTGEVIRGRRSTNEVGRLGILRWFRMCEVEAAREVEVEGMRVLVRLGSWPWLWMVAVEKTVVGCGCMEEREVICLLYVHGERE